MKALQLSLNGLTEEQREVVLNLAEVLKGSKTPHGRDILIGGCNDNILIDALIFRNKDKGGDGRDIIFDEEITLPLDTLKVCPWLCAKYGVACVWDWNGIKRKAIRYYIALSYIRNYMRVKTGGRDCGEWSLSLSQFEGNKVAGISIVEVG